MKTYRPYLSLSKNPANYQLGVIINAVKDQTIVHIRQEEVKKGNNTYWGVIVTLSNSAQLMNGPENPIFSVAVDIALDKSESYQTIMCSTEISVPKGKLGPAAGDNTTIGFGDATL